MMAEPEAAQRGRLGSLVRTVLPFVVSAGLLGYLLSTFDLANVARQLDARVARILLPALLLFGAVSLAIEAVTLLRVAPRGALTAWTAARVKAASYLASLIHYALGIGTVSLLLSRRAGMRLADAAGVVMLISLFDLGLVLLFTASGVAPVGVESPSVQVGVVFGAIALIGVGFSVLRAPIALGPLDTLRELELFRAARTTPIPRLLELAGLRLAFIASFMGFAWASLYAFDVHVPWPDLVVNFSAVTLVSMLPIAVAGLGTSQIAFVYFFGRWSDDETLLACSLAFSAGLILMRAAIGLLFAREFTREALAANREPTPASRTAGSVESR